MNMQKVLFNESVIKTREFYNFKRVERKHLLKTLPVQYVNNIGTFGIK